MKFKINRDHFANGLAQVLNVVGSKATMPILSNVLIEAEKEEGSKLLHELAASVSDSVREVNSAERLKFHLAAVLVNNFTNALYSAAENYINAQTHNGNFKLFLPIIEQTALKIKGMSPLAAQTGPAKRGDKKVMRAHLELLTSDRELQKIYRQLSSLIQQQQGNA